MTQGVVGGLVSISKSDFDFEVLARLAGERVYVVSIFRVFFFGVLIFLSLST